MDEDNVVILYPGEPDLRPTTDVLHEQVGSLSTVEPETEVLRFEGEVITLDEVAALKAAVSGPIEDTFERN
jgi:hypothetical protein